MDVRGRPFGLSHGGARRDRARSRRARRRGVQRAGGRPSSTRRGGLPEARAGSGLRGLRERGARRQAGCLGEPAPGRSGRPDLCGRGRLPAPAAARRSAARLAAAPADPVRRLLPRLRPARGGPPPPHDRPARRRRKPDRLRARHRHEPLGGRRRGPLRAVRVVPRAPRAGHARRRLPADPGDELRRRRRRPLPAGVLRHARPRDPPARQLRPRDDRPPRLGSRRDARPLHGQHGRRPGELLASSTSRGPREGCRSGSTGPPTAGRDARSPPTGTAGSRREASSSSRSGGSSTPSGTS